MENTIVIKDFSLSIGKKQIIDDLSFEVKKGEIFGLLGSNASGKTSIIRALLGLNRADEGKLLINGTTFEPSKNNHLVYLQEERGLYKKESVIDVMGYFGQLKGMSNKAAREWSLEYLEGVGLADKAKTKLDKLSSGQQQIVQLGTTII
ncbi:MAG: ATP-binding cassette domain-containing protein, partial [Candidatus Sacchiramonaceae bacterium]|nr:ATP-binding cassette domain-containing protein [Candidatus Saccharimonadaceae bacterium]